MPKHDALYTAMSVCIVLLLSQFAFAVVHYRRHHATSLPSAPPIQSSSRIRKVVVVMLENRSFDHYMGKWDNVGDGMNNTNDWNPVDGKQVRGSVAPYVAGFDPDHSTMATTRKMFYPSGNVSTEPTMQGFAWYEKVNRGNSDDFAQVLSYFPEEKLPVSSFLAREFSYFDRNFASVPGPTWPNRWFTLMGTAGGNTATGGWYKNETNRLYPQRTIFDQVHDAGLDWRYYYGNTPWELNMASVLHNPDKLFPRSQFYHDCKTGRLPAFSWLNPRSGIDPVLGVGSDDMHPDHDVAVGEVFLKEVYEALRASPNWNETALIVMFDEHGGFYDHVTPPMQDIPDPTTADEGSYPDASFRFNRLGLRVPLFIASPWIPRGSVFTDPPTAQKPFRNSEYEHTSVMATARKLLGIQEGPLTVRDGWAATFEHIFSLPKPRFTPPLAPAAPPPARGLKKESRQPVNDLQRFIFSTHQQLSGSDQHPLPEIQQHVHAALDHHWQLIRKQVKTTDKQYTLRITGVPKSFNASELVVSRGEKEQVDDASTRRNGRGELMGETTAEKANSLFDEVIKEKEWLLENGRIRSKSLLDTSGIPFCWTAPAPPLSPSLRKPHLSTTTAANKEEIALSLCRTSALPSQQFIYDGASIRHGQRCVAADRHVNDTLGFGVRRLLLEDCDQSVWQALGYYSEYMYPGGLADLDNIFLGDSAGYACALESKQ